MDVTRRSRLLTRWQNYAFLALFLSIVALLAWLSTRYVWQADWTINSRNTLSSDSRTLLDTLQGPVTITAYARDNPQLRGPIREQLSRYTRYKPDLQLNFVNPDAEPERMRELGISMDGELRVSYQGRSERVAQLSEQHISNALLRVARAEERWVVFLEGHGERKPRGQANHDLGQFGEALQRKGLRLQSLNLARSGMIPDNTQVLVIAAPQVALLPGEAALINDYVAAGGNLLWLGEPVAATTGLLGLEGLAESLGVEFLPGQVVDATTQLFGIQNPAFAVITDYPRHPVTSELASLSLLPQAAALELNTSTDWQAEALLTTLPRAWTETGPLVDEIRYDADSDERPGPLDIAFAFSRARPDEDPTAPPAQQRLIVCGDGDFLSNSYLGNGANLDLGLNMIHWLAHDDSFIAIRPRAAPDRQLALSRFALGAIGIGFLLLLPLLLLVSGLFIWLRRRKS